MFWRFGCWPYHCPYHITWRHLIFSIQFVTIHGATYILFFRHRSFQIKIKKHLWLSNLCLLYFSRLSLSQETTMKMLLMQLIMPWYSATLPRELKALITESKPSLQYILKMGDKYHYFLPFKWKALTPIILSGTSKGIPLLGSEGEKEKKKTLHFLTCGYFIILRTLPNTQGKKWAYHLDVSQ